MNSIVEVFGHTRREDKCENEFVSTSVLSSTSVFSALMLPKSINNGKQIHYIMLKNVSLSIVSVRNALIVMHVKCNNLNEAPQIFKMSSDNNSIKK